MLRNAGGTSNAYTTTCDFTPFSMPFLLNEVRAFLFVDMWKSTVDMWITVVDKQFM